MHNPSHRVWDEDRLIRIMRDGPLDDDEVDLAARIYRAIREPWLNGVCASQGFHDEDWWTKQQREDMRGRSRS